MIPRLRRDVEAQASVYRELVDEFRLRGFEGELSVCDADRTVFSTDNSIYQVAPQAVAFPRGDDDVVRIARLARDPRFPGIKLCPRGGGTGTNGQALTDGLVVDMSRHMNRILEVDPAGRWAWVQAGVVKDQLNDAVRQHGVFFAPELSTSNRATIGGMIATDASGQGSVLYGKTRDHILELKCVLLGGTPWHVTPLSPAGLESVKGRDDMVGLIHRVLDRISTEKADLIAERYPKLNRCVTGYDLVHLRDGLGRFRLDSVICGAEGTLAFVTAAKVNLVPAPRYSALVNIRYSTFDAALRDAKALMQTQAASSETLDSTVLELARNDSVWTAVASYFPDDAEAPARGVNLVEFVDNDAQSLEQKLARVEALLATDLSSGVRRGYTVARDAADIKAIWSMRKRSVGLLGNLPGERRPMPFVEDTVVPPEHLADYICEFRATLDACGLRYGMFGHVDAGCVHVRPALDMKDPHDERMIREITDKVVALTGKYKGVLWGEHGKGVRSEYTPEFFGPLYASLQEIKAAFDPGNQLNPGKIAAPPGHSLLKIDGVPTRGQRDRRIPILVRAANQDSLHCNGNAACFNYDPDDAMCPSWKVTRDRRHSPKGRASLMREWLTRLAHAEVDPSEEFRSPAWADLPKRALNTWRVRDDFSHEVKDAMDGCLACKSCVGQCPIKVDVPAFRSRFLQAYHGRYLRPIRDHLVGSLEAMLPMLARAPRLANALLANPVAQWTLARLGLVSLPTLDTVNLREALRMRGIREASPELLSALPEAERRRCVVVVQDAFTTHYDARLVVDFCELVEVIGFKAWLAPFRPNGKPQHVLGLLGDFERAARKNAEALAALGRTGVALVGVDPSMTLSYRSEYARLMGDATPRVELPQEWLAHHVDRLPRLSAALNEPWLLLLHCTERTNLAGSGADWRRIAHRFGMELEVVPAGCCGMAGLYGHLREQRARSEAVYEQSWSRHLADPRFRGRALATGYSCRSQSALMSGLRPLHPIQAFLREVLAVGQCSPP